ncbi:hypothetical protein CR513_47912, partial [Mucuna pruriens]
MIVIEFPGSQAFSIFSLPFLFYGLASEDPHKHLKKFYVVCSTMRPHGFLEDYIKMKAFSFSLDREGLMLMDTSMIDVASSGALMDKTPTITKNLIFSMVGNTRQFGLRRPTPSGRVNEVTVVNNQRLENKIVELTSLVRQLEIGQHHTSPPARVCDICTSVEHLTDVCSTLQATKPNSVEFAKMISGQQYRQPQKKYSNQRDEISVAIDAGVKVTKVIEVVELLEVVKISKPSYLGGSRKIKRRSTTYSFRLNIIRYPSLSKGPCVVCLCATLVYAHVVVSFNMLEDSASRIVHKSVGQSTDWSNSSQVDH